MTPINYNGARRETISKVRPKKKFALAGQYTRATSKKKKYPGAARKLRTGGDDKQVIYFIYMA